MTDQVRVLRIIEYKGPREWVEQQLEHAIHGTKRVDATYTRPDPGGGTETIRVLNSGTITVSTLGEFPEILTEHHSPPSPSYDIAMARNIADLETRLRTRFAWTEEDVARAVREVTRRFHETPLTWQQTVDLYFAERT